MKHKKKKTVRYNPDKRPSKKMLNKRIALMAILKGETIPDVQKRIRIEYRKSKFLSTYKIDIEKCFFQPCLYYLIAKGKIVYIGETESFMTRIAQHIKENTKLFDDIRFVPFNGTADERRFMEKMEIQYHQPHYNIVHNKWKDENFVPITVV